MSKNAVQRLQKIENDIKTVISFYDVSNKCKDIHEKSVTHENQGTPHLPQISAQQVLETTIFSNEQPRTSQLDFIRKTASVITQPSQDVYSVEPLPSSKKWKPKKLRSAPLSFSTLSTICEVSYVKTNQRDDYRSSEKQDPNPDTDGISSTSYQISKNESKHQSQSSDKINPKVNNNPNICGKKEIKPKLENQGNFDNDGVNSKNSKTTFGEKKVQNSQTPNQQNQNKTQKTIEDKDGELWDLELSKMIKKSNEKLKKMKVSKELALDIAKHLKEKYDEIQQSKQELAKLMLNVQKENEKLKSELNEAEMKIKKLKEYRTKQREQDVKTKETIEENFRILKSRMCKLEKEHREEVLEKQREIDKIQRERLAEIRNDLKDKENQAKDIQRLTYEKNELSARNDQLEFLLKDSQLEKQFLQQKICQLEEEVHTQNQHLKKKTETLEETIKELESNRQNSNDLEEQMKTLRKNIDNFHEVKMNFVKQIEEYEWNVKLNKQETEKLKNENLTLKTELENEKDALLIKTKIIDDQQETIKQLREKSVEAKTLLKEKESLERILNTEREEKLELQEAVERLKYRKEELKKKVKALESDLLLAPQEVFRDLQKTQIFIHELENQVQSKQKEWEHQLNSLIREKEQACNVAEYATMKLMQTNNEFQKQSEAHKRLRRILAENLAEKGKLLFCTRDVMPARARGTQNRESLETSSNSFVLSK